MDTRARDDALAGVAGVGGVRDLLYGRGTRRALRRELAALLAPDATLGPCRLDRAKYKPGRKLTGYYLVDVRGRERRATRAIEVVWSAEDDLSSDFVAAEAAMEDEARTAGILAPFSSLRADGTVLGARVRVWPIDVAFPHLVALCTPERVRDLLARALAGDGAAPSATGYSVTSVRYRPRQRHVLRYDPAGPHGNDTLFAKVYRPGGSAARAARIAHTVQERLGRSRLDVEAARPLSGTSAADVLLYPRVAGSPLSEHLWDEMPGPSRHLETAGALLRALHQGADELPPDLEPRGLAGEIAAVGRAAEHLGPLLPSAASRVQRILDRARTLSEGIPGEPAGFAHGDFKADHVWAAGDRVTLLDFDTCCVAEPGLDIGKFLADLAYLHAFAGRPGLADCQTRFLHGYGEIPDVRLARARLYEAVVLTKLVLRRLRRFDAHWSDRTEALTRSAEQLLTSGPLAGPAAARPAGRERVVAGLP